MHLAQTLTNLQKFLTLLTPSLSLDEMLTNVARQLVEMFGVDHSGVLFWGNDDEEGVVVAEYPVQNLVGLKVSLARYPLIEKLKSGQQPIAVLDAQHNPVMGNTRSTMRLLGIQSILIAPLVVQSKIVGSFSLDTMQAPRRFTHEEITLCHIIGNQIAVAIDYTRALEVAETSRRQAQTLREVSRVMGESLNLDEILPLILDQLEKVVPADSSSIFLRVAGGLQLVATRGRYSAYQEGQVVPLDELWGAREIISSRTPTLVSDTLNHPGWLVFPGSPLRSWLGVPLVVRGESVGVLNIDGYSLHQFNETHIQLAQAFAGQAAIAIYNARLYGQAQKRADLLASVQEIGLSMVASLDLHQVLREIAISVLTLLEAAGQVRLYLYSADEDSFTLAAVLDQEGGIKIRTAMPRKDGLTATVARTGHYLAIPDTRRHPFYGNEADKHGFGAIIGIPLKKRERVLGVLNVFYPESHHFLDDEINLLHLLATQAAVALENARLYEVEVKQVEHELTIARQIQQGLFPQHIPDLPGWEIATICQPARETGGDFYDFVQRKDGLLGLVVGDVSGKGISAAILMAAAQSVVGAKGTDYRSPAQVITESNHLLCDDVPEGSFVALAYALLEPGQGRVFLSNGGQLAPFLVPAGSRPVRLIETPGPHLPMGILEETTYQEMALFLEPGDTLVFHTDGVVEWKNSAGEMFGFERLAEHLEKLRGQPPQVMLQAVLAAAGRFAAGQRPADDVTLLVLQRRPG